jgi:hypothetical protein
MPRTSNGAAESDRITAKRYALFVNMTLAMNLPISLASNPFTAKETEFSETMLSLKVCSVTVEHMVPSPLEGNAKCVYVNGRNYGNNTGILTVGNVVSQRK